MTVLSRQQVAREAAEICCPENASIKERAFALAVALAVEAALARYEVHAEPQPDAGTSDGQH